jgi:hypothetical protein
MAQLKRARAFLTLLAILVGFGTSCTGQTARYFKAECMTAAGYIKLGSDGKYVLIWREHMGVFLREQGQWNQNGSAIEFSPTGEEGAPYQAAVNTYGRWTFLSWASDHASEIAIPVKSTEQELKKNPKELPFYVFFKTTAQTYQRETKRTYPFRFLSTKP